MILTNENYFSAEANQEYMSNSQYGSFIKCEAKALAELKGEWDHETTPDMLIGSFVDAHFSGEMDLFRAQTPSMFTKSGELYANETRKKIEHVIARIERDEKMMQYLSGEMQVIRTGDIAGVPWKIKMDVIHAGRCIVDLKIVKDFLLMWNDDFTAKIPWIEAWGYHRQGAVYQAVEGNNLPFIIEAATKEKSPDIGLFGVPQEVMNAELANVIKNTPRFVAIKKGEIEPTRCEKCDYCRSTRKLDKIVDYREI